LPSIETFYSGVTNLSRICVSH